MQTIAWRQQTQLGQPQPRCHLQCCKVCFLPISQPPVGHSLLKSHLEPSAGRGSWPPQLSLHTYSFSGFDKRQIYFQMFPTQSWDHGFRLMGSGLPTQSMGLTAMKEQTPIVLIPIPSNPKLTRYTKRFRKTLNEGASRWIPQAIRKPWQSSLGWMDKKCRLTESPCREKRLSSSISSYFPVHFEYWVDTKRTLKSFPTYVYPFQWWECV